VVQSNTQSLGHSGSGLDNAAHAVTKLILYWHFTKCVHTRKNDKPGLKLDLELAQSELVMRQQQMQQRQEQKQQHQETFRVTTAPMP
jgi:hypothetical protein